jgi:hypothetical protein
MQPDKLVSLRVAMEMTGLSNEWLRKLDNVLKPVRINRPGHRLGTRRYRLSVLEAWQRGELTGTEIVKRKEHEHV